MQNHDFKWVFTDGQLSVYFEEMLSLMRDQ